MKKTFFCENIFISLCRARQKFTHIKVQMTLDKRMNANFKRKLQSVLDAVMCEPNVNHISCALFLYKAQFCFYNRYKNIE